MTATTVEIMLTTKDNPFNPFTQWDEWYAYDEMLGYHTTAYLARVAWTSDELTDADLHEAIDTAIEDIMKEDPLLIYKTVDAEFNTIEEQKG